VNSAKRNRSIARPENLLLDCGVGLAVRVPTLLTLAVALKTELLSDWDEPI
jgi:hypothetical protein